MQIVSNRIFYFALTLIISLSCLEKYDLDFEEAGKNLTLNSELEINKKIRALVMLTKSPLDYDHYFTRPDAEVLLYEDGELFDISYYATKNGQTSIYRSDRQVLPDKEYMFKIKYKDFPELRAVQRTFDYPNIENILSDSVRAVWLYVEIGVMDKDTSTPQMVKFGKQDTHDIRSADFDLFCKRHSSSYTQRCLTSSHRFCICCKSAVSCL